jgi:uroporphyrinogen decarboxylase
MENKFLQTLRRENTGAPPVWMMRQAGRYHAHYQGIRKDHSFLEVCKTPALAAEVAMGPMRDFDFDAAILFSDILFPLEAMGIGLDFAPGPKLSQHLRTMDDLKFYNAVIAPNFFEFQAEGLRATRAALPAEKGLIGFVGAPLTLYFFAVECSHKGDCSSAHAGLLDGRFAAFMEKLHPVLLQNMKTQAAAKPDAMAMFDSCGGDIPIDQFKNIYLPHLAKTLRDFNAAYPDMPIIYYGKHMTAEYWNLLRDLPITCLGVDHGQDMARTMQSYGNTWSLQGNFDPGYLTLPPDEFRVRANEFFGAMKTVSPELRRGWVCALGHGVTPQAHEDNVREFVQLARRAFA